MEALRQAQEQKMVRYLASPATSAGALMEAIRRHPFDTILMALNAADGHHFSFQEQLLGWRWRSRWGSSHESAGRSGCWPVGLRRSRAATHSWEGAVIATRRAAHMREALYYSLSHPVSTVIIGCDTIANWKRTYNWRANSPAQPTPDGIARRACRAGSKQHCSSGSSAADKKFQATDEHR